ncbi:hypothetical protein [Streptomyces sp. NPDC003688]
MIESWVIADDGTAPVAAGTVREALRERIGRGRLETWLVGSSGRSLAVLTNTERALVMLLAEEGDPGEHAVDPEARGSSAGFVSANGQHDAYPNADTVPLGEALSIVEHIVRDGAWPPGAHWVADR